MTGTYNEELGAFNSTFFIISCSKFARDQVLFTVSMAGRAEQPAVSTCSQRDQQYPNAPGSIDVDMAFSEWQAPAPLSDEATLEDLKKSLDFAHHNIEVLRSHVQVQDKRFCQQAAQIDKLQSAYQELYSYAVDLEDHILSVDTNSRKKNLIVTGIPEVLNENSDILINKLYGIFQPYLDILDRCDFDVAYRLGTPPKNHKKNRPIVVKFFCESIRNLVSQIRFNLEDDDETARIYLNDNLPKILNVGRYLMRLVVKTAKEKNIPAKVSGNNLLVNNVTYEYRNMDCLPSGLRPGDIMVKEIGGNIVFNSEHAWISNFYPTPVKIQNVTFGSAEQAFQYIKARRNKAPDLAALILKAKPQNRLKR